MAGSPPNRFSGTFAFQPTLAEFIMQAFSRIGVRRTEVLASHLQDGRVAANLVLSEWSNLQPNLWVVDLQSIPLTAGQATYDLGQETINILDAYLEINAGGVLQDYYMTSISRTDYASYPNKFTPGWPTVYWFDRTNVPSVTLWPPPDSGGPYQFNYYRARQPFDADPTNGLNVEIPYRFNDAFTAALAYRLGMTYLPLSQPQSAPAMLQFLMAEARRTYTVAAENDVEEQVPLLIAPGLDGYYR